MEGAREFQISVEYEIYCNLNGGRFKWTNRRTAGELPLVTLEKVLLSCLYGFYVCFIVVLCNHMLLSQILTSKLPVKNMSFYI